MIQAVVFDMDGLMIDSERVWQAQWPSVLAKFGLTYKDGLKEACVASSGTVFEGIVRGFYPDADCAGIREELWDSARRALEAGVDAKPGLYELMDWLDENHVRRAIASASNEALIRQNVHNIGLDGRFDAIVAGEMVTRGKPFPDTFLLAAEKLGADPTRTVVLEDSNPGIRAAAAGGFIPVMVPDLIAPQDDVRGLYARCCTSLLEVRDLLAAGELG
ncbi:MAG: HAD family phosphatase [Olsenella sp.]|nr:HAD family phosphatase [Olsenella sp.]